MTSFVSKPLKNFIKICGHNEKNSLVFSLSAFLSNTIILALHTIVLQLHILGTVIFAKM